MFAHSSQCEAGPPPNFHDSKTLSSSNWSATSQKTKNRGCPIDPWYFMEMMKITNWFKSRASSIRSRRSSVGASTVPPEPTPVLDVQVPIPFPEEKIQRYCKGGYHPTILGDLFQKRYKVVRKLGYGPNSTVWLALDEKIDRHVALKIFTATNSDGIGESRRLETLKYIREGDFKSPGRGGNLDLFAIFALPGPHGIHSCLVMEPMHQNLLEFTARTENRIIPLVIVKEMTRQLLSGLDYLHRSCDITHTDIQARNILVSVSVEDFDCFIRKFLEKTPPRYYGDEYGDLPGYAVASEKLPIPLLPRPDLFKFKFAGLGMSQYVDKTLPEMIQAPFFRAPEVIIGAPWGHSADIWNFGCIIFELLQGRVMFWGKENKEKGITPEEDHLGQMIQCFGTFPLELIGQGKYSYKYFDCFGDLIHVKNLAMHPFPLEKSLSRWNPSLSKTDVVGFTRLVRSMMRLDPNERRTAQLLLRDPWLNIQEEIG
ncbi:uncharacterized protein H6S33_007539 [Morchella sextelata]|uniref:uncharacterized protein n=1 Tax=Morchella sextelata TaxID=1174677 RepID=UPI001D039FE5|nr:uncharacterized protein H6S33_007539 [Morchella sextelata]KAH0603880.1 hypothetical protein H6S33_007539 [Morchella sextelata]